MSKEKNKTIEINNFKVVLLGIIFDPATREILIGRRESDEYIPKLRWSLPGGRVNEGDNLEETLKTKIKEKTGLDVESLGSVLARIPPEKSNLLLVYYLCESTGGMEKPGQDFKELHWIKPNEFEKYFTTSVHPHLKEYVLNLK